jgi:hypothetical protein
MLSIEQRFQTAWSVGDDSETAVQELLPVRLARAAVQVLGVPGTGISVFTNGGFRVPLGASDAPANAAERLQFTHGTGPCLEALRVGGIVHATAAEIEQRWPALYSDLRERTPFASVVSVPLHFGALAEGALDIYLTDPDGGPDIDEKDLSTVATGIVTALALSTERDEVMQGPSWLHGPTSRRRTQVWIALGLLNARLNLPAPDALARLRSYAYARDLPVDDVAEALVARKLAAEQLQL